MMKVALASGQDIDAALNLLGILDALSRGYYPKSEDSEHAPLYFDEDDKDHLSHLWKVLRECLDAAPGFQGRVLFGAATLMDSRNKVVDSSADTLELHPRLVGALQDADRLDHLVRHLPSAHLLAALNDGESVSVDVARLAEVRALIDESLSRKLAVWQAKETEGSGV
jgi:hypothetical protein